MADSGAGGASCLGPHSGLKMQETRFQAALASLTDAGSTTVVLVTRPEAGAIAEAARTWDDRFDSAVRAQPPAAGVTATLSRWAGAFSSGYREYYPAAEGLTDLAEIDAGPTVIDVSHADRAAIGINQRVHRFNFGFEQTTTERIKLDFNRLSQHHLGLVALG